MRNVKYIPEMFCKIFRLTKAMRSGYKVTGRKGRITLKSRKYRINFDRIIQSGRGILLDMMTEKVKENNKNM